MRYGRRQRGFGLASILSTTIPAILVGGSLGAWRYNERQLDQAAIPLAFSEIKAHQRAHEEKGGNLPPLTEYYAMTNDLCMKIFEANNLAHSQGGNTSENFARELQIRMDPAYGFPHDLISEYLEELPEISRQALEELATLIESGHHAGQIQRAFENAWDEHHQNHYRRELETYSDPTVDGNIKTRTVEVYDHTVHTYDYNPQQGRNANRLLEAFVENHSNPPPHLLRDHFIPGSVELGAENMQAMEESRQRGLDGAVLDETTARSLAHTWVTGANLCIYYGSVVRHSKALTDIAPEWNRIINQNLAHSHRYQTSSHTDSGPAEFRVAEDGQAQAAAISDAVNSIVGGMMYVNGTCPQLAQEIDEAIAVGLGHIDGNAKKEMQDVLDIAHEMYGQNFEGGFDTTPTSWLNIILISLVGTLPAGALGLVAERKLGPIVLDHLENRPKKEKPQRRRKSEKSSNPPPDSSYEVRSTGREYDIR